MKNFYEGAEIEVYFIENEDVIATSTGTLEDLIQSEDNFNGGKLF